MATTLHVCHVSSEDGVEKFILKQNTVVDESVVVLLVFD